MSPCHCGDPQASDGGVGEGGEGGDGGGGDGEPPHEPYDERRIVFTYLEILEIKKFLHTMLD